MITEFLLGSTERVMRALKGPVERTASGAMQAQPLEHIKNLGHLIATTSERRAQCAAQIINIHDNLERDNFELARAHSASFERIARRLRS